MQHTDTMTLTGSPDADVATESYRSAVGEVRRSMEICNACRYCEGFCAVFPAMEERRQFSDGDCDYLANLCHNCRGCYYACQYAPPHDFGLNLPEAMAELRAETYEKYAWPGPLAKLFQRNGLVVSLATAVVLIVAMLATLLPGGAAFDSHSGPGAFYAVVPYQVMVGLASAVFGFVILALVIGFVRFWRATGNSLRPSLIGKPLLAALGDVLTLRHLGGGGHGCNDTSGAFSTTRRRFHHATFYGFMLCFAATSVATVYDHVFGWVAPYGYLSLPVLLGTVGGISLCIGTAGLLWLKLTGDPRPAAGRRLGMDVAFIVLLFLTSLTGLVLLAVRETPAMGTTLAVHLGFVFALFLMLPYSKFVHAVYRFAALLRYAVERLGPDFHHGPDRGEA